VPAPAVIPAPIAYIKVVAVKKLVVGFKDSEHVVCRDGGTRVPVLSPGFQLSALN